MTVSATDTADLPTWGQSLGLIGLGLMGTGIARNFLGKGHALAVYDLSADAVARAVGLGARAGLSPRDVAAQADVVVTVLPDGPQLEAVVLGPEGVLAGARPGTVLLDCSTVDPAVSRQVGAAVRGAGCRMVDAGMGRSPKEAAEGSLILMVGAEQGDYDLLLPLLEEMGTDIFHCGGPGLGITMKVINNLLATTILSADLEALIIGRKAGLGTDLMLRVLTTTGTNNPALRTTIPAEVVAGDYRPLFKAWMAHKDLGLGENLAAKVGVPLFALASARQLYSIALAQGKGDLSLTVIGRVLEELAGGSWLNRIARKPRPLMGD
ncbi:MAG: NAD(P)-dependent oxidoreductase [Chloroflexota bacterium]